MWIKILNITGLFFLLSSSVFARTSYFALGAAYNDFNLHSNPASYIGVVPMFALGYGDIIRDPIYLSGEFFINPITPFTIDNGPIGDINLKPAWTIGFSLLPTYLLDEFTHAFFRVGATLTRFDKLGTTRSAYQVGAGLEIVLDHAWNIRGEFDYGRYSSISGVGNIRLTQWAAAFVYKFC